MTHDAPDAPLRLGHITYSNCFPVHARLLDHPQPGDPTIVEGIPSALNALLARGEIDAAPCSSIEFARHAERYRVLPDLVIGSRGPVHSILLLSRRPADRLAGATVALPTASATSVVLLRILLRRYWGVAARHVSFDQAVDDPFAAGAEAALFIGDVALRDDLHPALPHRYDLGEVWGRHTGLPFAFAVWQSTLDDAPLRRLHRLLVESRRYGLDHLDELSTRHAPRFGFSPDRLRAYWRGLSFTLDDPMREGLRHFYRLAAEIGEIEREPTIRWG